MSVKLVREALASSVSTSPAAFVLVVLAEAADDDGRCWLSVATVCARTRLGRRTVQRSISELRDGGWLDVEQRDGRSTVYLVSIGEQLPTRATAAPAPQRHPRHSGAPTRATVAPTRATVAPPLGLTTKEPPSEPTSSAARVKIGRDLARQELALAGRDPGLSRLFAQHGISLESNAAKLIRNAVDSGRCDASMARRTVERLLTEGRPITPSTFSVALGEIRPPDPTRVGMGPAVKKIQEYDAVAERMKDALRERHRPI